MAVFAVDPAIMLPPTSPPLPPSMSLILVAVVSLVVVADDGCFAAYSSAQTIVRILSYALNTNTHTA